MAQATRTPRGRAGSAGSASSAGCYKPAGNNFYRLDQRSGGVGEGSRRYIFADGTLPRYGPEFQPS